MRKFRQLSTKSRTAFWTVVVTALVTLALVPIQHSSGSLAASVAVMALSAVMIVGLGVLGVSLRQERHRVR